MKNKGGVKLKKNEKMSSLLDNERNLVIYTLLGFIFVYTGFNLPLRTIWIFPAIFSLVTGVLVVGYGVFRYLERRRMVISSEIQIDEGYW